MTASLAVEPARRPCRFRRCRRRCRSPAAAPARRFDRPRPAAETRRHSVSWPFGYQSVSATRRVNVPTGRLTLPRWIAATTSSMPICRDRQLVRIELHPHRVFLRAEHVDLRDAAHHRNALRQDRLGELVDRRSGSVSEVNDNSRIGRFAGLTLRYEGGVVMLGGRSRAAARSSTARPAPRHRCCGSR